MTVERRLARAYLETHPRQAARALERLAPPERAEVLATIDPDAVAPAVREMVTSSAAECLACLSPRDAATVLCEVTRDYAAELLRPMAPTAVRAVLAELPEDIASGVATVLHYPEGTAGALMDPTIFQLPDDIEVGEARERLMGASRDLLYYLYVVDREHRLVGVLDIPELMVARPRDEMRVVMHAPVERIPAWTPASLVPEHAGWRLFHAMPVVDDRDVLVGAIRYQTLRRLEQMTGGDAAPARATARALGELYTVGLRGLLGGIAAAAEHRRVASDEEAADA